MVGLLRVLRAWISSRWSKPAIRNGTWIHVTVQCCQPYAYQNHIKWMCSGESRTSRLLKLAVISGETSGAMDAVSMTIRLPYCAGMLVCTS